MGLWLTLVLVDLVTVATFARCFSGPGELLIVVPVCLLAHLVAHVGRLVGSRTNRTSGLAIWLLALLLVAWVPIAALDWHSLTWGLPLGRTWHVLDGQFHVGWAIFSNRVAPVVESRGLVIATAWAAGAVGLAAEALDADATLPAIVALVPAFDIVVFTGTLGTTTARAPELAALAALAVAYLAGSARRAKGEQVVTARVEGSSAIAAGRRPGAGQLAQLAIANGSGRPGSGRSQRSGTGERGLVARWRRQGLRGIAAPGLVAIAALSAGVLGPLLPGATSAALVAWHGGPDSGHHGPNGNGINHPSGPISISSLVQVGEQEVDNPDVPLLVQYGPEPTREVLATLDIFNGNQWLPGGSRSSLGGGSAVPKFFERNSIQQLERHPVPLDVGGRTTSITEVVAVSGLGGNELPVPGEPVGIDNLDHPAISTSAGAVLIPDNLFTGETYVVKADLNPGTATALQHLQPGPSGAPAIDTSLPLPVPVSITALANQWTQGNPNPVEKALSIQAHLADGLFRYALPRHVPSGQVSNPGAGYAELANFLYKSKTGYCQQFATAFAVMARIEGLPTRIVVGLLPGTRIGSKDAWKVTGTEVHAWPQVYFKGTGWVDFEPTPGSPTPVVAPAPVKPTPSTTVTGSTKPGGPINRHFTPAHPGGGPAATVHGHHSRRPRHSGGGSDVADIFFALLAAAALWALAVPAGRLARLRFEERDPLRGVMAEWRASVKLLAVAGFHRRRAETFDEFARRVRAAGLLPKPAEAALVRLVQATNRALFGKRPPTVEEMRGAVSDAHAVRRAARKRLAWWQRILVQLDPRDLARVG